jgi:hypothetical protein
MDEKTKVPSAETRARFESEAQALEDAVFVVVKEVIDHNDPETLLSCGAPNDEYDPISRRIAQGWIMNGRHRVGETGLAHIVALQWHMSFGDWTKPVQFYSIFFKMAEEMLPKVNWNTVLKSTDWMPHA